MVGYFCEGGGHNGRECSFFRWRVEMSGMATAAAGTTEGVGATQPVEAMGLALTSTAAERQTAPIKLENLNQAIDTARELEAAETTLNELASNGMVVVTDENRLTSTFTKLNKVELRDKDASGIIISFQGREIPLDEFILAREITDDQKKEVLQGTAYNENTCFVAGAVKGESGQGVEGAGERDKLVHQTLERLSSPLEGNGDGLTTIDPILVFSNRGYSLEVPQQTTAESAQPIQGVATEVAGSALQIDAPTVQAVDGGSVSADNANNAGKGGSEQSDNVAQSGADPAEEMPSLAPPAGMKTVDQFRDSDFVRNLADQGDSEIEELFKRLSAKKRVAALEALGELKGGQTSEDTDLAGHAEKIGTVGMLAVWNQVVRVHSVQNATLPNSETVAKPTESEVVAEVSDTSNPKQSQPAASGKSPAFSQKGKDIPPVQTSWTSASSGPDLLQVLNDKLSNPQIQWHEEWSGGTRNGILAVKTGRDDKHFVIPDLAHLRGSAVNEADVAALSSFYDIRAGTDGTRYGLSQICEIELNEDGTANITKKGILYLPQEHMVFETLGSSNNLSI